MSPSPVRPTDRLRGLAALAAVCALVGAPPILLLRSVGAPWHTPLPSGAAIRLAVGTGHVPAQAWIHGLSLVVWAAWLVVVAAVAAEAVELTREGTRRRLPAIGGVQRALRPLLVRSALLFSMLSSAPRPVAAAALPDLSLDLAHVSSVGDPAPALPEQRTAAATTTVSADRSEGPSIVTGRRDTLLRLARTHLGDESRWPEIRALNLGRTMPDGRVIDETTTRLGHGWELRLPADAVTEADDVVVVEDGDHLWSLAEERLALDLGRSPSDTEVTPYWAEVVEHNRDRLLPPHDPDLVYPGQEIALPPTGFGEAPTLPAEPESEVLDETPVVADAEVAADPEIEETAVEATPTPEVVADAEAEALLDEVDDARSEPPVLDVQGPTVATSWATRAGAGLVAAGLAAAVVRARRRRESLRRRGEGGLDLDAATLAFETTLAGAADPTAGERCRVALSRALGPLPPLGEPFAPPRVVVDDGIDLVVHAADGSTTSFEVSTLDHSEPFADLLDVDDRRSVGPTLVALGPEVHLDLETAGLVGMTGDRAAVDDLVRAMVHQLTLGPTRDELDVRCSALAGRTVFGDGPAPSDNRLLVTEIEHWSDRVELLLESRGADDARRVRLADADALLGGGSRADRRTTQPLVLVIDDAERGDFAPVLDLVVRGRLPLAVVVAHADPVPVDTQISLEGGEGRLLPDGHRFTPLGLPLAVAEEFADLVNRIDSAPLRTVPPLDDGLAIEWMRNQDAVETLAPETADETSALLEIAVLGPIEVRGAARPLDDTARSALALLAIHGPQSLDELDVALWPAEAPDADRVASFVAQLGERVGPGRIEQRPDGRVALNGASCDLVRARSAIAEASGLDGATREAAWRQALSEIRGPAFDGCDWPWLADHALATRARTTRLLVDAALTVADEATGRGSAAHLRLDLRRARRLAPWHEELSEVALGLEATTDHGPRTGPDDATEAWKRAG